MTCVKLHARPESPVLRRAARPGLTREHSKSCAPERLTARNLAFFVLQVLSARRAKLLDGELLRHRPLVLRRVVVRTAAGGASELDDVAHGRFLSEGVGTIVQPGLPSIEFERMTPPESFCLLHPTWRMERGAKS